MDSANGSTVAASELDGLEEEDPSSNNSKKVSEALDMSNQEKKQIKNEDELSAFREQWQRELESTPIPQGQPPPQQHKVETVEEFLTEEDKAKQLFLRGVELERSGKLYEAIQHYKRAMQLVPDVETKLYESSDLRADTPEETETEEVCRTDNINDSDDEDAVEGEDLLTRLQRIMAKKGLLCEPAYATKGAHLSWLPYEAVLLVLRWVVSSDLDAMSLEHVAATCRGLYIAAREPDFWRSLCVRTWGIECGTPRSGGFATWRQMYIERPRLRLHGCYISKTTYLRHGENSFQDQFYRPWYIIDYYRYLRFFPEGLVLMWTTPDEPAGCVTQLKYRSAKHSLGIMSGHYRLIGDKVVIVIKKAAEKTPTQAATPRYRTRRKETPEQQEQIFHLELQLRDVRSRRNWQLQWQGYSVSTRRDQWTQFDLTPAKFPAFAFSLVRSYTAEATAPLPSTYAYT